MKTSTDDRLSELGRELRASLLPVVREIAGPAVRPAMLVRRLEIDKSLASRLSRAFRADDPLEFLHLLPAPTGLRIILSALARAGVDPELQTAAEVSVDRFHAMIDETPGGRATIDAAISAYSQEARDRNEKSAKQAMYKAMSYLLGIQCESIATSFVVQPSDDDEKMVDCVDIIQRSGVRRLRPTAPVGLFSHRLHPKEWESGPTPQLTTLDGRAAEEAEDFILREFSSEPLPDLEVFRNGHQTTIALAKDEPAQDSPLTVTLGLNLNSVLQRYRTPDCEDEWRAYLLHYPCKTLVRDVWIREDLYVGTVPEITLYIPSPRGPETVRHKDLHGKLNTVDLTTHVEYLGLGLENTAVKEIPSYAGLVRHAFEKSGWDPSRFRGYRTKIVYPVPNIYMYWWFALPDPPAGS